MNAPHRILAFPSRDPGMMIKVIGIVVLQFCLVASLSAQVQTSWVAHYDYSLPGKVHKPLKMVTDKDGDIIVAGSSANGDGDLDYVVLKYSSDGYLSWSYRYNSSIGTNDELRGLVLDDNYNVLLTGTSRTVKLDTNGKELWTNNYGGRAVAADTNGNVYVTGYSDIDYSTVKIAPTGTNAWERFYDKIGHDDVSQSVAVDKSGNVYVAGVETCNYYIDNHGIAYIDAQPTLVTYDHNGNEKWSIVISQAYLPPLEIKIVGLSPNNLDAIYVVAYVMHGGAYFLGKISVTGKILWNNYLVEQPSSEVESYILWGSNVYVCGRYSLGDPVAYHNSYSTYNVDTNGNISWNVAYNGPVTNYHNDTHQANAIAVDKSGCVYVTGISQDASNGFDWATVKYDPQGREVWVQRYDGPAHKRDEALSLVVDDAGNVYVTGTSETKEGGTEIVTIKYSQTTGASIKTTGNALIQYRIDPSQTNHLQTSTNLTDWATLDTLISDALGLCFFEDTNAPIYPHRFYRLTPP